METQHTIALPCPISTTNRTACLVHIYPTGQYIGRRYPLGTEPVVLGRGADCDLSIDNASVSRRHAQILAEENGYVVHDLESTNGTFVNDAPANWTPLKDGDYLRVGGCIYRFLMSGNVEADYHQVIYKLSIVDALTEVHNKRYLLEFLERELARSLRHNRPMALVMLDIDHFKTVNDTLGHLGGDATLRDLTARIKPEIRQDELFARYGGDEFAAVLPETDREGAIQFAERLRHLTADQPLCFENLSFHVTISLGVATTNGATPVTAIQLIEQADQKLYQAKRDGRNRVVA